MGWANDQLSLIVLSAAAQGYSGFFVYSPSPGPGNLVGSWTAAAGTDPYGNAYPAGLSVTDFNLQGSDFIINSAGAFFYSGTPAAGNLFISLTFGNGTDDFGNPYQSGVQVHGSGLSNIELTVLGGVPRAFFSTGVSEEAAGPSGAVIEAELTNPGPSEIISLFLSGAQIAVPAAGGITPGQLSNQLTAAGSGYAVTWATNPTAGQKIIIVLWTSASTTVTAAVDNGTTPSTFTFDVTDTNTAGQHIYFLRADNITLPASGAYTVTLTVSGSSTVVGGGRAYSGVKTGAPTATNSDTGTGTAVATNSATPAAAGALAIAGFTTDLFVTTTISGAGGGFTNEFVELVGATFAPGAMADQIVAGGPSPEAASWTVGNSAAWVGAVAVYDAAPVSTEPGQVVYITLDGEAKDASFGALAQCWFVDSSGGLHSLLAWSGQGVQLSTMIPGDDTTYQAEELRLTLAADIPITSSTAYVSVLQTPENLGTGTYEFEGMLKIQPTANNGKINIIFVGGTMVNTMLAECWEMIEGAPALLGNNGGLTALGGAGFTGSVMSTGIGRTLYIKGTMIVTTAGVFGVDAINAVAAADTFTIKQLGSYLNLKPVGG